MAVDRRIAAVWLPHLGAERALRALAPGGAPVATATASGGAVRLASVDAAAQAAGLAAGMTLADARALRPDLLTRPADPPREAAFLQALARWAGRFSPWVATDGAADAPPFGGGGLALDVTGCAHLFGGEPAMLTAMTDGLADLGLTARAACADTLGAAWALARFAPGAPPGRGGAVSADAPATRVRAPAPARRGAAPAPAPAPAPAGPAPVVAPPGRTRAAIAALPVAALRLPSDTVEGLARLGLRTVEDVALLPRGGLARRFGVATVRRLDQALGAEPEPVAAGRPPPRYAVRLSLPEPVGRVADVAAGLDRLLARLCATLEATGMGARRVRLTLRRVDGEDASLSVGLARPARDPAAIAALFARALEEVDAGFGIDALRLVATVVEPLAARQRAGVLEAADAATRLRDGVETPDAPADALASLLSSLGNRLGFDAVTRLTPADSHIPERAFIVASAAFSDPHPGPWPAPPGPRPLTLLAPAEPAAVETGPSRAPVALRWRRRRLALRTAAGPERIAPAWWLDDPDWRDGPRDYWRVETEDGMRLWLYHLPAAERPGRWSVAGVFA